jgi:hypothetical protein
MPATYLRNRARSLAAWGLEVVVRSSTPSYEYQPILRASAAAWDPPATSEPVEHPELPGLWLMRGAVPPSAVSALRALADATISPARSRGVHGLAEAADREVVALREGAAALPSGSEVATEAFEQVGAAMARRDALRAAAAKLPLPPPPKRGPLEWEWFEFEPGRRMAPMLAHPMEGGAARAAQQRLLANFEVFGHAPVESWLCLAALANLGDGQPRGGSGRGSGSGGGIGSSIGSSSGVGGDAAAVASGAAWLRHVQGSLPRALPCVGALADARCLFWQWQLLERGASVSSHVDAPVSRS